MSVPALRFPEFDEPLETKEIGKIASVFGGFAFPSSDMSSTQGDYQIVKMSNLFGGELDLRRNPSYIRRVSKKEEAYLIRHHDILMTLTGTFGKTDFGYTVLIECPQNLLLNQRVGLLRGKAGTSPSFLALMCRTTGFQRKFHRLAVGGTGNQSNVSTLDCKHITMVVPSLPEQKKIAAFLGVVDAKIAALRARRDGLERYKRGLMQALFSHRLRFTRSDGSAFPDWEEKRLGDFIKVFSGGTPSASVGRYYSGQIPFIKSGEIGQAETAQFLSQEGFDSSSAKMVEVGDLLYALYGATTGEVRISRVAGAINQAVLCIRTEQSKTFLLHWLGHNKEPLKAKFLQGGQGNFSADIVKRVKIALPHPDEQAKIAEVLSAMDAKIAAVKDQVTQMEAFKKGLLQQMFV